jgi:hypothetical protein
MATSGGVPPLIARWIPIRDGEKIADADKAELTSKNDELKQLLKDESADPDALRSASDTLMQVWQRASQSMHEQAAQAQGPAGGGDETSASAREQKLLQGVAVIPLVHIQRSRHATVPEPERRELPGCQIPPHHEPVLCRVGEPAILAAEVVLVGEEERPQLVRSFGAQQVARDVQSLILGVGPVLYTDPVPIFRMIMGRHIAGGVYVGIGAAQSGIDSDPAIGQLETGRVGEGDVRCSADADQYRVSGDGVAALDLHRRRHAITSETLHGDTQPQVDTMITMERGERRTDLLTDDME